MPNLAAEHASGGDLSGYRRGVSAFRTLLAGDFAASDCGERIMLEALLAATPGGRVHEVLPEGPDGCPIVQAEVQLAREAVDIVLLDLNGPVEAMLSLVGCLRAAAGGGVAFVGVLTGEANSIARLYLSAAVDEVVERPLRADSLHRAIADALEAAADQADLGGLMATGGTRH